MKIATTVIGIMCLVSVVKGQGVMLVADGTSPNLYLTHKIEPKENYYSIGRMYNVSPKELAPFNNLDFAKGLSLGQVLKIPLTQNNFVQGTAEKNDKTLVPVYHIVAAKEGLYRVSTNFNKVSLEQLKKWNNLSSDAVSNGTKLIVGFLKVQKEQSPLAKANNNGITEVPANTTEKKPVVQRQPDAPKEMVPPVKNPEVVKAPAPEIKNNPVVKDQPANTTAVAATKAGINFNGGGFKNLYQDQLQHKPVITETGLSGVFKSTSGWRDGKYYCFHNGAQPGTILKITNASNNKTVYAKVLDLIPDINKNVGLILHISNSAAEELGVSDNKFDCTITYAK